MDKGKDKVVKKSEIKIEVGLNQENIPLEIYWQAVDNPETKTPKPSKALLLSLFDEETKDTLKIDLWTQDMQIFEMDRFVFQTIRALADTYFKATQNKELAADMQRFANYFGEKTEIIPKSSE